MQVLLDLIQAMNKEEIRHYKMFSGGQEEVENRKDIALFNFFKKNGYDLDEEEVFKQLYDSIDKNSYYRLKNRLQEEIGYSLSLMHITKNDSNFIFWLLSLYEILIVKKQWNLAHYFLKRAEKKGVEIGHLELLDLIFAKFIQLSNELLEINPEVYIQKRFLNAQELNKSRTIDQVLAALNYRLKTSQNFAKEDKNLLKLVDKTLKEFAADKSIQENKNFQTKLYRLISQTLVQRHSFIELEKFMMQTFQNFEQKNWFSKSNHDIKLQMLVYIINSKYYTDKFEESLAFANILGVEIKAFDQLHFEKYLFFYYNSLVINYTNLDFDKAITALDTFETLMRKRKNSYYDQFIYLNRATLSYERKRFNEGIRALVKFYLTDSFKKANLSFQLKIEVAELIMQYESKDLVSTKKRVEQVRKKYSKLLQTSEFFREERVIYFITELCKVVYLELDSKLYKEIKVFANKKISMAEEEGEIKKYNSWVAAKLLIAK